MWDNRERKKNPKSPDYTCKDKENCKWKMTKSGWEPSDYATGAWIPKGEAPKTQSFTVDPESMGMQTMTTSESINRAVALKAAVEFHGYSTGSRPDDVLNTAGAFLDWLAGKKPTDGLPF